MSLILFFVCNYIEPDYDMEFVLLSIPLSIGEVLNLQMSGIPVFAGTGVGWYLSSMVISLMILHPLVVNLGDKFTKTVVPVVAILLLGFIWMDYGTLNDPGLWLGFGYKGLLRGFADICLGIFVFNCSKHLSLVNIKKKSRKLFMLLDIFGLVITASIIIFCKLPSSYQTLYEVVYVLILTSWMIILFSRLGVDYDKVDMPKMDKISTFICKYSLCLFLCHYWWFTNINTLLVDEPLDFKIVISIICVLLSSLLCMYLARMFIVLKKKVVRVIVED